MPPTPPAVATRGFIDVIHPEGSASVVVSGWVLPAGSEAVDRLEVALGGEDLRVTETRLGCPSEDILAAYPRSPLAGSARFHVRVAIEPRHLESGARSLVRLTPYVGPRRGHAIFGVHESAIPRPSEADVDVIGGGYDTAFEFLSHFVELGGLRPNERVLDVGCGVGRMAIPLAFFLSPDAPYRGFDIAEKGLAWARDVIGSRFPNFEFTQVDVKNEAYNPAGTLRATEFAFPYRDRSFDFVFLTSVFTHLRGPETRHYLNEIARVLDGGGRCLATAFLLDAESRSGIASGASSRNLVHPVGDGFTSDVELPENAIGFDEPLFLSWARKSGLRLQAKHPGGWCGRDRFTSYQDILVFAKA